MDGSTEGLGEGVNCDFWDSRVWRSLNLCSREDWREVKWESRSDQVRVKEEREEECDWRSSKAFRRFSFLPSTSFRAAEIAFVVAICGKMKKEEL